MPAPTHERVTAFGGKTVGGVGAVADEVKGLERRGVLSPIIGMGGFWFVHGAKGALTTLDVADLRRIVSGVGVLSRIIFVASSSKKAFTTWSLLSSSIIKFCTRESLSLDWLGSVNIWLRM